MRDKKKEAERANKKLEAIMSGKDDTEFDMEPLITNNNHSLVISDLKKGKKE